MSKPQVEPRTALFSFLSSMLLAAALLAGCRSSPPPAERTDDGLVRVPSRSVGGVYRNPDATFTQYRRVSIEPLSIGYAREWRRQHPEVTDGDVKRLETTARENFQAEVVRILVDQGPYNLAGTRDPDVLRIVARIIDLDIPAPDAAARPASRTYSPRPVRMQISGELRDAATDTLLLRVIVFEGESNYATDRLRLANRATNTHEMRDGFNRWARLVREALDVAKVQRLKE